MPFISSHEADSSDPPSNRRPKPTTSPRELAWLALSTEYKARSATLGGLPMPSLPEPDSRGSTFYSLSIVDKWGRLAERSTQLKLGWLPATAIAIALRNKLILVTANRSGSHRLTRHAQLQLPAEIRHAAHINAGDQLLVAAHCDPAVLIVYPMPVLDAILTAFTIRHLQE